MVTSQVVEDLVISEVHGDVVISFVHEDLVIDDSPCDGQCCDLNKGFKMQHVPTCTTTESTAAMQMTRGL